MKPQEEETQSATDFASKEVTDKLSNSMTKMEEDDNNERGGESPGPSAKERAKWLQEQAFKKNVVTSKGAEIKPSSSVSDRMKWLSSKVDEYQKVKFNDSKKKVMSSEDSKIDQPLSVSNQTRRLSSHVDECQKGMIRELDGAQVKSSETELESPKKNGIVVVPSLLKNGNKNSSTLLKEGESDINKAKSCEKVDVCCSSDTETAAKEVLVTDVVPPKDDETKALGNEEQNVERTEDAIEGVAADACQLPDTEGTSRDGDSDMMLSEEEVMDKPLPSVSDRMEWLSSKVESYQKGVVRESDTAQAKSSEPKASPSDAKNSPENTPDSTKSGVDLCMHPEVEDTDDIKFDEDCDVMNCIDVATETIIEDNGESHNPGQINDFHDDDDNRSNKGMEDLVDSMPSEDSCSWTELPESAKLPNGDNREDSCMPPLEEVDVDEFSSDTNIGKIEVEAAIIDEETSEVHEMETLEASDLCEKKTEDGATELGGACPVSVATDISSDISSEGGDSSSNVEFMALEAAVTASAGYPEANQDQIVDSKPQYCGKGTDDLREGVVLDTSSLPVAQSGSDLPNHGGDMEKENSNAMEKSVSSSTSSNIGTEVVEIGDLDGGCTKAELEVDTKDISGEGTENPAEEMSDACLITSGMEEVSQLLKRDKGDSVVSGSPREDDNATASGKAGVLMGAGSSQAASNCISNDDNNLWVGQIPQDVQSRMAQELKAMASGLDSKKKEELVEGKQDSSPSPGMEDTSDSIKKGGEDDTESPEDEGEHTNNFSKASNVDSAEAEADMDADSSQTKAASLIMPNGENTGVNQISEDIQSRMALELKAMALDLEARKVEEQQKMTKEQECAEVGGSTSSFSNFDKGDIQACNSLEPKGRKLEEKKVKKGGERAKTAEYQVGHHFNPIQGDIQSRMALELRARKVKDQKEKRLAEERIKEGGYKMGVVDQSQGDIQSRMALELKARKMDEQRNKREAELRVKAGGYRASMVQDDIQSRMALELKARKAEDQKKRKEQEELIKAGGYKVGVIDQSQGDIQSRLALELKARKVEEQRKKREEEERVKMGGYQVSAADLGQGDIQSRLALELKARKVEDQRQKTEAAMRVKTGGRRASAADLAQGDIQSRMALELKARKSEEQRRKKEVAELVYGYRAGITDLTHGNAQTRVALEMKARKEEDKRKRNEADELAKSYRLLSMPSGRDGVELTKKPALLEGKKKEQTVEYANEQGVSSDRNSLSLLAAELSQLEGKMSELQTLYSDGQGSEEKLRSIQSRTASELKALEGIKKEGKQGGQLRAVDQDSKEAAQAPVAAELLALKGKKQGAMEQYLNDKSTPHKSQKGSASSASSELAALRGKIDEAQQLFDDQANEERIRNIQSRTATELKVLEGKRQVAEEQLSGAGNSGTTQSPAATELKSLAGKTSEAKKSFVNKQLSGAQLRNIQSRTATELKVLEGKRKEAEEQLLTNRSIGKKKQSSRTPELQALEGKTKEAMDQFTSDQGSSDEILSSIKSRTASELTALQGKKKDAEENFSVSCAAVEMKDGTTRLSTAEYCQVKKFFVLVAKDGFVGMEEVGMLLGVFGKTTGRTFSEDEIANAFTKVDGGGLGCIEFDAFFKLYTILYA